MFMQSGKLIRFARLAAWAAVFVSLPPGARAQNFAACTAPDPTDAQAVYACAQVGRPRFDLIPCNAARDYYAHLLVRAGMPTTRALENLPACELIARVALDLSGRVPDWNGCLGYPGRFDPEHFKRCLGSIPEPNTCPALIDRYRRGLMASDPYGQLPPAYADPDCQSVAVALTAPPSPEPSAARKDATTRRAPGPNSPRAPREAVPLQWTKCLDYDPAALTEHMQRCLGPDLTRFTSCESVQRTYERNIKAAYNGLPAGYVTVTCPQAQVIVKLAELEAQEKRKAKAARIAPPQDARRARPGEPSGNPFDNPVREPPATTFTPPDKSSDDGSPLWSIAALLLAAIVVALALLARHGSLPRLRTLLTRKAPRPVSSPQQNFKQVSPQSSAQTASPAPRREKQDAEPDAPVKRSRTDPLDELEQMVGLAEVKKQVAELAALVKYQQARKRAGLPVRPQAHHLVFTGNPGTGKTTVARIIGEIYQDLGLLRKGHLVEVGRKDLIGKYWGTALEKTQQAIDKALDGVLFIDEAYALNLDHTSSSGDSYGQEVISTLISAMEEKRDRLAVIAAGYEKDMDRFLEANAGLSSRFATRIHFPDYNPHDLVEIFRRLCASQRYRLTPAAEAKLQRTVNVLYSNRGPNFGNGREMRNLFENAVRRLAARLGARSGVARSDLQTLTEQDIPD